MKASEIEQDIADRRLVIRECELRAYDELFPIEQRATFWVLAQMVRETMIEPSYLFADEGDAGLRPCATEGCRGIVAGADFCARCESMQSHPYPLANVLMVDKWRVGGMAIVAAAAGIMTYGMYWLWRVAWPIALWLRR